MAGLMGGPVEFRGALMTLGNFQLLRGERTRREKNRENQYHRLNCYGSSLHKVLNFWARPYIRRGCLGQTSDRCGEHTRLACWRARPRARQLFSKPSDRIAISGLSPKYKRFTNGKGFLDPARNDKWMLPY